MKVLSEHELRQLVAQEIPLQYRSLAAAYYGNVRDFLQKHHLLLVQAKSADHYLDIVSIVGRGNNELCLRVNWQSRLAPHDETEIAYDNEREEKC